MKKPTNGPSSQNQGPGEKQRHGQRPRPERADPSEIKHNNEKGPVKGPRRGPQR